MHIVQYANPEIETTVPVLRYDSTSRVYGQGEVSFTWGETLTLLGGLLQ
jgi:hypothetical protein